MYVSQKVIVVPEIQAMSPQSAFIQAFQRPCTDVLVDFSTRNFKSAKDPADVKNRNLIQFCPVFFGSNPQQLPQSSTEAVTKLQAQIAFEVVPAMAIVHEAQHSIPIVGGELHCVINSEYNSPGLPLALARVGDLKVTDPKDNAKKKAYSLRL
jgi:hypothetical protein